MDRRVGDKVRIVATGRTGFGLEGDFFIEAISRRVSHGRMRHEVTWTLSPA